MLLVLVHWIQSGPISFSLETAGGAKPFFLGSTELSNWLLDIPCAIDVLNPCTINSKIEQEGQAVSSRPLNTTKTSKQPGFGADFAIFYNLNWVVDSGRFHCIRATLWQQDPDPSRLIFEFLFLIKHHYFTL